MNPLHEHIRLEETIPFLRWSVAQARDLIISCFGEWLLGLGTGGWVLFSDACPNRCWTLSSFAMEVARKVRMFRKI